MYIAFLFVVTLCELTKNVFINLIQGVVLQEEGMRSLYQFLIADKTDKDSKQDFPDFSIGPRRYLFFGFRDWLDIWHSTMTEFAIHTIT